MVSSALRMSQFAAAKQLDPGSRFDRPEPSHSQRQGDPERAIARLGRSWSATLNALIDSFALLTSNGEILLSNPKGNQLLQKIQSDTAKGTKNSHPSLPDVVVKACRLLLENSDSLAQQSLPSQMTLTVYPDIQLRISLIEPEVGQQPLFLVAMEDRRQSSLSQATVDQRLFGLTNREKEVWELRLQDYGYQAIAAELYLSVNTVKKHMKTILAKQEQWRCDTFGLMAS